VSFYIYCSKFFFRGTDEEEDAKHVELEQKQEDVEPTKSVTHVETEAK
jgi:hypothetical protein